MDGRSLRRRTGHLRGGDCRGDRRRAGRWPSRRRGAPHGYSRQTSRPSAPRSLTAQMALVVGPWSTVPTRPRTRSHRNRTGPTTRTPRRLSTRWTRTTKPVAGPSSETPLESGTHDTGGCERRTCRRFYKNTYTIWERMRCTDRATKYSSAREISVSNSPVLNTRSILYGGSIG